MGYSLGRAAALYDLRLTKQASFIDATHAWALRAPAQVARVAGRSPQEFAANALRRYATRAPQFAQQAADAGHAAEKVLARLQPGAVTQPPPPMGPLTRGQARTAPPGMQLPMRLAAGELDSYAPDRGIRLARPFAPTAGHEAGHAVVRGNHAHSGTPMPDRLHEEAQASLHAAGAQGHTDPFLVGALGTYLENAAGPVLERQLAENAARQVYGDLDFQVPGAQYARNRYEAASRRTANQDALAELADALKHVAPNRLRFRTVVPADLGAVLRDHPELVPPAQRRLLENEAKLWAASQRRERAQDAYENARRALTNPYLNQRVAPQTAADKARIQAALDARMTDLEKLFGPGTGDAGRQFLAQQEAAGAGDPYAGERLYRQAVERSGLTAYPEIRDVLQRFRSR